MNKGAGPLLSHRPGSIGAKPTRPTGDWLRTDQLVVRSDEHLEVGILDQPVAAEIAQAHPERAPIIAGDGAETACRADLEVERHASAPIRTRVEAREARSASLARVEPFVESLFLSLHDPARVIDCIKADQSLSPLDQKTALQLVLAKGLASQPTSHAAAAP